MTERDSLTGTQTALGAYTVSGWTLVDRHPANPSGYGVDCPDCGRPLSYSYWPVDQDDVPPVNGFGCEACQNVVPTRVTETDRRRTRLGGGLDIVEAEFRDGSIREVRCARRSASNKGGASA